MRHDSTTERRPLPVHNPSGGHYKLHVQVPAEQQLSLGELFKRAVEMHCERRFNEARESYRAVLAQDPQHIEACHLLGFVNLQLREFAEAVRWLRQAVQSCPDNTEYRANLGLGLLCTGKIREARQAFDAAAEGGHSDIESLLQTSLELYRNGQLEVAEAGLQIASRLAPSSADAFHYWGVVQKSLGRFDEAVQCYQRALAIQPNYPEALNNLGNAYRDSDHLPEAVACYEAAIELSPEFAAAYNNLGVAQAQLGDLAHAAASFEAARRRDPHSPDPLNNLGNALRDVGRVEDARACYQLALTLSPESAEILNNLGTAYQALDQTKAAIDCFRRSLQRQPTSEKAIVNLAGALADQGQFKAAETYLRQAAQLNPANKLLRLRSQIVCPPIFLDADTMQRKWRELSRAFDDYADCELPSQLGELLNHATPPPFATQFFALNVRPLKEAYARIFSRLRDYQPASLPPRERTSAARIGIVVTEHHEGVFLKSMRGVLERLDPARFELTVVCAPSGLARLQKEFAGTQIQFVRLPWRLDLAAEIVRTGAFDLLLYWEVGTDGLNYFLPHLRLAPIQCTSWGIQVTSGIPNVDYYLSSRLVEPPDAAEHYSEKLLLADSLLCYRYPPPTDAVDRGRERFGFTGRQTIFACPQQLGKFHPDFDRIVGEILRRCENAVFALTADPSGQSAKILQDRLQDQLPDVCERIAILPRMEFIEYLSLLNAADVLLDPPHFGGVNSTYDGLALGKPIVTTPSQYHRGRYTFGCYQQMGLDDCIAHSTTEYVELACRLAADAELRGYLEGQIRSRAECIFRDTRAVAEHERLFTELLEGGKPNDIS